MSSTSSSTTPTLSGITVTKPSSSTSAATSETASTSDKTPWDSTTSHKFENKRPGEYFDPCQEAASKSLKCLHRNGGDKEMCSDYFQAYRDCKKQWINERKAAKTSKRKESGGWFS